MLATLGKLLDGHSRSRSRTGEPSAGDLAVVQNDSAVYQTLCEASVMRMPKRTSAIIKPYPGIQFDCTPDDLLKALGEPELNLYTPQEHLLFYRLKRAGYKLRTEFHFHRSRLFYARRTFEQINLVDKDEVVAALRAKYLKDSLFDPEEEKILDPHGNEILVRTSSDLQLDYLRSCQVTPEYRQAV
ncbi:hypothetical protein [Halochromatium glycolicum]|uniref:hypothetical protein n=1 Tax=Halochromatium glycolicum TaxID=85075 RepID=UPI00190D0AB3|nr:hypothetical protein [Halochromatium glycolicum]